MAKRPASPDNTPNIEELFNMAVEAAKQGQRKGARVMFRQILEKDKRNVRAMMYMAKLAATDQERIAWLEKMLEVKPGYEPAEAMLSKLRLDKAASRNRRMFRLGIGAYVVAVVLVAALIMIAAASLTL
jgi:cytochrome c-type biogenesis protein CcmH/NrfG